jgi:uncharacterized protein YecT (DUF1311 family)
MNLLSATPCWGRKPVNVEVTALRVAAAFVLALLCAPCLAGAVPDAAVGTPCRATASQRETDDCARRDFQAADAALAIAYAGVMERLSPAARGELRKEHRAWLASRDTLCKSEVRPAEGGPKWEQAFYACLEASTRRRVEKVKAWPSSR